jgi:hypothetical protein
MRFIYFVLRKDLAAVKNRAKFNLVKMQPICNRNHYHRRGNAEPFQTGAEALSYRWRIFTDAAGEDESVVSPSSARSAPIYFLQEKFPGARCPPKIVKIALDFFAEVSYFKIQPDY